MAAHDMLHPDQFGKLKFGDFPGGTIDEVADHLYMREPQFMDKLESSVRRNGVREPIELGQGDRVTEGHHRIAAAYRAGQPVPYVEQGQRGDRSSKETTNSRRWRNIRRDLPDEYAARMNHSQRNWRDQ
jgi:ParB-like chromosome segregation protein Spo0J